MEREPNTGRPAEGVASSRRRGDIVKAAGIVSGATLASRITGFLRDMIIAQAFGAGMATDAFFVAFRIPYLLRRLLGEGSLTASFIPVFTEVRERGAPGEDRRMVASTSGMLLLVVALLTGLCILYAPAIIRVIAPGFAATPEKYELTVSLTRIVSPYLIFVSFFALYMGVLNATGRFFAPAAAPVFLSLAMILAAVWLAPRLARPIDALAWGVLLGGVAQMAFQVPYVKAGGYLTAPRFFPLDPAVKRVCLLMVPALFGLAAGEINLMVDTLLASLLPEGSVSFLYYGNRLVQFPLGLIGIALGTAIFPTLSSEAARMDMERLKETMVFGLRMVLFITLPAMIGLMILAKPIIALLFQRGAFTAESTRLTAQALLAYSFGLASFSAIRILVPTFYSLQDTRTPFLISLVSMAVNIVLNLVLMVPLKHAGLALATSIAALVNVVLLVWALRRKIGPLGLRKVVRRMVKPLLASGIMAIFCLAVLAWSGDAVQAGLGVRLRTVLLGVSLGGITYFAVARFMRTEELSLLIRASARSRGGDAREGELS